MPLFFLIAGWTVPSDTSVRWYLAWLRDQYHKTDFLRCGTRGAVTPGILYCQRWIGKSNIFLYLWEVGSPGAVATREPSLYQSMIGSGSPLAWVQPSWRNGSIGHRADSVHKFTTLDTKMYSKIKLLRRITNKLFTICSQLLIITCNIMTIIFICGLLLIGLGNVGQTQSTDKEHGREDRGRTTSTMNIRQFSGDPLDYIYTLLPGPGEIFLPV
jgi:hypothetical protein